MFDHGLLNGMHPTLWTGKIFDGDGMAAVERRQKSDAGIDGLVEQIAVPAARRSAPWFR